jgi:hypothetical protein
VLHVRVEQEDVREVAPGQRVEARADRGAFSAVAFAREDLGACLSRNPRRSV